MENQTSFESKCFILSEVWHNYRYDKQFDDFIIHNDLGLPLAFAITEGIIDSTPTAQALVEDSFSLLLNLLGVEDTGFDSFDDILNPLMPE